MTERLRNIAVGLTSIAGLIGLAAMMLLFGTLPAVMENGYEVRVELPGAGGLSRGSRVRYAGIDVGSVINVNLQAGGRPGVLAVAKIRREIVLREGTAARVLIPLIGGSPTLELDDSKAPAEAKGLPTDGSLVLRGVAPSAAEQFAREFKVAMEETLKGPMAELEKFRTDFHALAEQWTRVGQQLAELTEPGVSPADVDAGRKVANLATVLARADQRLSEMRDTMEKLNKWVGDDRLRADVKEAATSVRRAADRFDQSAERISDFTRTTKASLDQLANRYVAVADDLSGAIASARAALDQVREGKGTVGQLLNNPKLYDNLNDTVQRVDRAMVELRLLIEKWKAEGLPVHF